MEQRHVLLKQKVRAGTVGRRWLDLWPWSLSTSVSLWPSCALRSWVGRNQSQALKRDLMAWSWKDISSNGPAMHLRPGAGEERMPQPPKPTLFFCAIGICFLPCGRSVGHCRGGQSCPQNGIVDPGPFLSLLCSLAHSVSSFAPPCALAMMCCLSTGIRI
jgi:hypothetical protein